MQSSQEKRCQEFPYFSTPFVYSPWYFIRFSWIWTFFWQMPYEHSDIVKFLSIKCLLQKKVINISTWNFLIPVSDKSANKILWIIESKIFTNFLENPRFIRQKAMSDGSYSVLPKHGSIAIVSIDFAKGLSKRVCLTE